MSETVADVGPDPSGELDSVVRWRFDQLTRAGYEATDAIALASEPRVDLHRAVELLRAGCESQLAVRILS